jgi:E-phenylitaconyl-CoA hydratase
MSVVLERDGSTAIITIDRPQKLNAMDSTIYAELGEAFAMLDSEEELLVGILTGSGGRAFSAGADLNEMHGPETSRRGWGPWRPDRWSFGRTTRKPLIAAIDGFALAGGLELALICDIRIATPSSTFGAPEVRWALLHGLGATRLPATVGLSNTMLMLMTGESIDAAEALRIGLVSKLVEPAELLDQARAIAAKIAENDAIAVQMSKELALRAALPGNDEALRLYSSYFGYLENLPEQAEATASFAKRDRGA